MRRPAAVMLAAALAAGCARGGAGDPGESPHDGGASELVDAGSTPPPPAGACADGFERCEGVCVDERLSCGPRACATPADASELPGTSRGFAHTLRLDGDRAIVRFEPGPASDVLPETLAVAIHLRIDGRELRTAALGRDGAAWVHVETGVQQGQILEYYFTQTLGPNSFHPASPGAQPRVDSAWFRRELGAPAPAAPAAPLVTRLAARFRDRHRNEWRFDHYVDGYDDAAIFELVLTDRGTEVDVEVIPEPGAEVGKLDLKWYETFGETPFCHDPPALAGLAATPAMVRDGDRFRWTIPGVAPGQMLELELTFTDRPDDTTYYSEWFHYLVGTGRTGGRVRHPWAYAAGPGAAVADVTVHQFAYAQHLPSLTAGELRQFLTGKILFETDFETGTLFNPPTAYDCNGAPIHLPPRPSARAGDYAAALGPVFDQASCIACHHLDGRGAVPDALVVRLVPPDPTYGAQLGQRGEREGGLRVDWQAVPGAFDDGTPYSLRRPVYTVEQLTRGPLSSEIAVRAAPPIFGAGLLEAVPVETILGFADEHDADGDGISGRPSLVGGVLGRFGWQASEPSVRAQAAAAFDGDMGVSAGELAAEDLDAVAFYARALSVPPRDNYNDPAAIRGKALFEAAGCGGCHVPNLVTAVDTEDLAGLAAQPIQPFTDLLLHDMGDELADASGREWRTAPLWGAGYAGRVLATPEDPLAPNADSPAGHYLHDGRARSLMEAILWHGGEAEAARELVRGLSASERDDLVAYVRYPFADPLPVVSCTP